ncbi:MAG: TetR/AcrR family transcriptional regulator [Acidimicrobiia bacterium]|nr:TetR/AcrR family transcriptional regulator [Acidimicrobiia bacterium]
MLVSNQRGEVDTRSRILDTAERLVQTRGFNAFSYADVAAELGITKPALHYHFPGKAELGEALLRRYGERFGQALADIDARGADGREKLEAYADLYRHVLAEGRMCLCGMLAADYQTLSEPMREAIIRFFDNNERWLAAVLDEGEHDGTIQLSGPSAEAARLIVGALEGAMLVARTYGDVTRFDSARARLLTDFSRTD